MPKSGGRWYGTAGNRSWYGCGGGLVKVAGNIVWGVGGGNIYTLLKSNNTCTWKSSLGCGEYGARLAVFKETKVLEKLVFVGGMFKSKSVMVAEIESGKWSSLPDMLVGSRQSCVVSIGAGCMVVMGGYGDYSHYMSDVQVFDGKVWHHGPPLPQPCEAMSAVVHEGRVYVAGGWGMGKTVWCTNTSELVSQYTMCSIILRV